MEWLIGIIVAGVLLLFSCAIYALANKINVHLLKIIAAFVGFILPIPAYVAFGLFLEFPISKGYLMEIRNNKVVSFNRVAVWGWNASAPEYPKGTREITTNISWQAENFFHHQPFTVYYQNIPTLKAHQQYYDLLIANNKKESEELQKYCLLQEDAVKLAQLYASNQQTSEMLKLTAQLCQSLYPSFEMFGLEIIGVTIGDLQVTSLNIEPAKT